MTSPDDQVVHYADLATYATEVAVRLDRFIAKMADAATNSQPSVKVAKALEKADHLLAEIDRNLRILTAIFENQDEESGDGRTEETD